ncbi:MAG: hypothetical protein AAFQ89_21275 [Cyanobacteria bacterium J06626_18]
MGDLNPQLLRELKGRLKRFPVLAAICLSLLLQLGVMLIFSMALPGSIQTSDLNLGTYPQIGWGELGHLDHNIRQEVSPADAPRLTWDEVVKVDPELPIDLTLPGGESLETWLTSNVYITHLDDREPARGDKTSGLEALNTLQIGDRLVAIDGQPITLTPDEIGAIRNSLNVYSMVAYVNAQMAVYKHQQLTPKHQGLIDTTVELTLYRPDKGQFTVQLPRVAIPDVNRRYCLNEANSDLCEVAAGQKSYRINWLQWNSDVFQVLTLIIVLPLMGLGTFLLTSNLAEEKRRGTLNFLQMSPRSPLTILGGKLLGAPICLYLAVGLVLPLHWFVGLNAGYSMGHLLGFDVVLVAQTLVFYLAALVFSLSTGSVVLLGLQPWLLAAGVVAFQCAVYFWVQHSLFLWYEGTESLSIVWTLLFSPFTALGYMVPNADAATIGRNANIFMGIFRINFAEYVVLTLVHAFSWYALLGHGLQRRFSNSTTTLLKRRFSYPLTLIFMAVALGLTSIPRAGSYYDGFVDALMITSFFCFLYCMALILALSPARQTLKDWARFRQTQTQQRLSLWQDLIMSDTSSPVVAIVLNFLLMAFLYITWVLGYFAGEFFGDDIDGFIFFSCVALFIGSLVFALLGNQTLLLLPRKKNWLWFGAVSSISCLTFPTITFFVALLFSFRGYPDQILGMHPEVAAFALPLSLMAITIPVLAVIHTRQIALVGRSDTQALLRGADLAKA